MNDEGMTTLEHQAEVAAIQAEWAEFERRLAEAQDFWSHISEQLVKYRVSDVGSLPLPVQAEIETRLPRLPSDEWFIARQEELVAREADVLAKLPANVLGVTQ